MPAFENHEELQGRLKACNEQLNTLFVGLRTTEELKRQLLKINEYYQISLSRATDSDNADTIVASYELYVKNLTAVKKGDMTANEAIAIIKENKEYRAAGIVFHNIAKVCEIMFWTAVVMASYITIFSVGLPLLLTQLPIGLIVGIGSLGLALHGAEQLADCFEEFKSLSRLKDETKIERNVVSFFMPQHSEIDESAQQNQVQSLSAQ